MPTSMIATISSEVPTGRSMKIRDGFMSRPELLVGLGGSTGAAAAALAVCALWRLAACAPPGARRSPGAAYRYRRTGRRLPAGGAAATGRPALPGAAARAANLGAVAQPVGAVDHHLVADLPAP